MPVTTGVVQGGGRRTMKATDHAPCLRVARRLRQPDSSLVTVRPARGPGDCPSPLAAGQVARCGPFAEVAANAAGDGGGVVGAVQHPAALAVFGDQLLSRGQGLGAREDCHAAFCCYRLKTGQAGAAAEPGRGSEPAVVALAAPGHGRQDQPEEQAGAGDAGAVDQVAHQ